MSKNCCRIVLTATAFVLFIQAAALSPVLAGTPEDVEAFLKEKLGLKAGEIASVEEGKPFAAFADAADEREVALFGVVRLDAPAPFIGKNYRKILSAGEEKDRESRGFFSAPTSPNDVKALSLPAGDLKDLRECKVGDCKVKLFREDIEFLNKEVDWSADDVQGEVDERMRRDVLLLVDDYRKRGDDAIPDYADKEQLMNAAKGFDFLLQESNLLFQYLPAFYGSIRTYPEGRLEDADDFIFWTVEDPGSNLKKTVFLVHAFLFPTSTEKGRPAYAIALKRLFATHYYYASLQSFTLVDHSEEGAPKTYALVLDRSLFDGKLGGLKKKMLRNGLRKNLEDELRRVQQTVADLYRASPQTK